MNEPVAIPLKLKYRNKDFRRVKRQWDPEGGTLLFQAGTFKSKSSNQGGNKHKTPNQGWGIRRTAYGPFNTF